jgi:predicted MFS family arabinose efflux permease
MVGAKLYTRKSFVYFHLVMYGVLALAGGVLLGQAISRGEKPSGLLGFVVVFGMGMFIMTLVKSRRPQISVYKDFMELRQSRTPQLVRYRNLVAVSRPDQKRLVLTLQEDNDRKYVTVWLKDLAESDVDPLADFLAKQRGKG